MNIGEVFPSKYLKAMDLQGKEVTVTLGRFTMEEMGHGTEKKLQPVVWFQGKQKGLILNHTNAMVIAGLYGAETDNWAGGRVVLFAARVKAFGAVHDVIRVKAPSGNAGPGSPLGTKVAEAPAPRHEEDIDFADDGELVNDEPEAEGEAEVDMWETLTPPFQNLRRQGVLTFSKEWQEASKWLIIRWTTEFFPDHVTSSELDLSGDQADMLADYIRDNKPMLQKVWKAQKPMLVQATA